MSEAAAIGLRVRTGRAVAVVLRGTRAAPQIVVRFEIQLHDRWVPESLHPYHHELREPGRAGEQARRRGCKAAEAAARRAMRALVSEMRAHGLAARAAAMVVAGRADPATVARAHPRAHAEEDRLYRDAVEAALRTCGLRVVTLLEQGLRGAAAADLGRSPQQIEATLKGFSHTVGTPWRSPEKHAALAAWLALPGSGGRSPGRRASLRALPSGIS